jgi:DNA-binding response OmpR family regulator
LGCESVTDILIIEDDQLTADLVCDFLSKEGYSCAIRASGEAGLEFLRLHKVKLVMLDITLPGMNGFAVCEDIHKKLNTPLIIVSARDGKDNKLTGFRLGADDYMEKPFDMDILKAKINALYRRYYSETPIGNRLIAGDLLLDIDARAASFAGKSLDLSQMEYNLLCYLVEHKGRALRKDTLMKAVWGYDCFSEPSTLTVHIKRLRDKIEKDSANPSHIITVWGIGYKYEE